MYVLTYSAYCACMSTFLGISLVQVYVCCGARTALPLHVLAHMSCFMCVHVDISAVRSFCMLELKYMFLIDYVSDRLFAFLLTFVGSFS